jgi:prevent-host-death family protein
VIIYTYSEARQKLATLLDRAVQEGEVLIKRKDGRVFVLKPQPATESPLDVAGLDLKLGKEEILEYIREGRRP